MSDKQVALFDVPKVTPADVETDAERQERHRLHQAAKEENEHRHERWLQHNRTRSNPQPCPCDLPACKARRK